MKTILISLLLIAGYAVKAQVVEDFRVMNQGTKSALTVIIPNTKSKYVDDVWKRYTKPYGKITSVKKADESVMLNAIIPEVSTSSLNVYNLAESVGNDTKQIVWFDLNGNFVSSANNPSEYANGVKFLQAFKHEVQISQAADLVELETKEYDKREDDLKKLEKQNANLHDLISDMHKKISKTQDDIAQNLRDQDEADRKVREAENSPMEQKEKDKLVNAASKLRKANVNMHEAVEDANKRISKAEDDIKSNLRDQENAKKAIEVQQTVLQSAKANLETIRSTPPR